MADPRPPTYCIPAWPDAFESAASRKLKAPQLCFHPNRAGRGMRRLARLEHGAAIYGCFVALCNVQSARRPDQRLGGWLTDDGTELGEPWTAEDMEDFTGFDAEIFERMLAVLSAPRIGWLSVSASEVADSPNDLADSANDMAEARHRKKERKKERRKESESVSSLISETETNGGGNTEAGSVSEVEADSVSEAETSLPPPTPMIFKNPRAIPCNYERQMRTIQAEIDAHRAERHLAAVVGHMSSSPIAAALREPGVTPEHLLAVVAYEFAKYDAAPDKADVVTHLTASNLFNPRYLSDAIDRAGRYAADPDAWNFAAGNGAAGLAAERAAFNAKY